MKLHGRQRIGRDGDVCLRCAETTDHGFVHVEFEREPGVVEAGLPITTVSGPDGKSGQSDHNDVESSKPRYKQAHECGL